MKKVLQILIILLITVNCSESKIRTETVDRTLYVFDLNSLKRTENYKLTIQVRDTLIKYEYQNQTDQNKNLNILYFPTTKTLKFGLWNYIPKGGNIFNAPSISNTGFFSYVIRESEPDGTGPILFNPEYGILGIGNVMAPNFIYLNNKSNTKYLDEIIKTLTD